MSSEENSTGLTNEQISKIDEFISFTGSDQDAARHYLEACDWDLNNAVTMQFDTVEDSSSSNRPNQQQSIPLNDEVRAPIPPVRQVLVEEPYPERSSIPLVRDGFRDFRQEARWREQREAGREAKIRTLEDLFRPPLDLIFTGSMESARDEGTRVNKWLLINIQNTEEFACQVLNRDVWSNAAVKSIINEHFVFWQVYHSSRDGQRYMHFYEVNSFPYIAIIDPRTGECLRTWTSAADSNLLCEWLTDFLSEHPYPSTQSSTNSSQQSQPQQSPYVSAGPEASTSAAASSSQILEPSESDNSSASHHRHKSSNLMNKVVKDDVLTYDDSCSILEQDSSSSSTNNTLNNPSTSTNNNTENDTLANDQDEYRNYFGTSKGEAELILRFPDGKRESFRLPCDSQLKALFLFLSSRGYSLSKYDLVTNFPRRSIHDLPCESILEDIGLIKEQLYIQLKS